MAEARAGRHDGRMRRAVASIRVRIVVGYLLLLTLALLVAILVTRQVQLTRADRAFEQEQRQEAEELRRLADIGSNPATGVPFGDDVAAIVDTFLERNVPADDEAFYTIVSGRPYRISTASPPLFEDPRFLAAWTVDTPTSFTATTDVGDVGEVRSLAIPLLTEAGVGGVFVVASFPADDYREVDEVVRLIALVSLAVLLVTSVVAWSLAGRVLRPVRELTATARGISESDLTARIPVEGHDELAELGNTFNDMVARLEHGFTSQRQFLDDVAHELRTPITIARGHLEVLGDDPVERAETIGVVTDELDRMSRYVSDLLVLAKAEQPDFLVMRPVDPGELALDVFQRVHTLGTRSWVLDGAPPVGATFILADPDRLMQALLNLAGNAVQHTDANDEVGVGVAVNGQVVRLWMRDTGPGVDPAMRDSIFDRYSRAATSRTRRRPEGTGLGLSIVDAVARAHGGSASVESQPGQGATFVVAIPIVRPQATAAGDHRTDAFPAPAPPPPLPAQDARVAVPQPVRNDPT